MLDPSTFPDGKRFSLTVLGTFETTLHNRKEMSWLIKIITSIHVLKQKNK